jgi:2-polyprenyl-3-methyl-5-hydroxy-6-metoxy-1,4-benzoquinol methylase
MSPTSAYDRVAQHLYGRARTMIAPEVRNSQYVYAERLREALRHARGRWLDIGCGHDFLPPWMPDRTLPMEGWSVAGIDMDADAIARHPGLRQRVIGNGQDLPFNDATFDLVTANMVVEHVPDPARLFREIGRVLAPNGTCILHTPNVHGYTTALTRLIPDRALAPLAAMLLGRRPEDVYPTFYRANSVAVLRQLAANHHLAVAGCELVHSSPQAIRIPPLMVLELLLMRAMRSPRAARFRACLIATLTKTAANSYTVSAART